MGRLYDQSYRLLRPLLCRIDPETAHRLTLRLLRCTTQFKTQSDPPKLHSSVFGLNFPNPLGLAAGMDKNAFALAAWNALGFGFVEIGTITPRPQAGNPRPRIWRLPEHHALINRMGFPSNGLDMVLLPLREAHGRAKRMRIAVNLGPNRDSPPGRIAEELAAMARRIANSVDFIVINLSSPNTPGLRDFQAPERMRVIVETIKRECREIGGEPPLLIKIAPDLELVMLADICAAMMDLQLAGVVATNTSLNHAQLGVVSAFEGGLSGEPLKERALEVIGEIYRLTRGRTPIIGVGGIASAEDAYGHVRAGASLVELYTGLIYHGPGLVDRIKSGLGRLLDRDGFSSISEAVGADLRDGGEQVRTT